MFYPLYYYILFAFLFIYQTTIFSWWNKGSNTILSCIVKIKMQSWRQYIMLITSTTHTAQGLSRNFNIFLCQSYFITCQRQSIPSMAALIGRQWVWHSTHQHQVWRAGILSAAVSLEQFTSNNAWRHWSQTFKKNLKTYYCNLRCN